MVKRQVSCVMAAIAALVNLVSSGTASAQEEHVQDYSCIVWQTEQPDEDNDPVISSVSCGFDLPDDLKGYTASLSFHAVPRNRSANHTWAELHDSWDQLYFSNRLQDLDPQIQFTLFCRPTDGTPDDAQPETTDWVSLAADYRPGSGSETPDFSCTNPDRPVLQWVVGATKITW